MTRVENWPELLDRYIDSRRDMPFEWGANDCCSFAAEWVRIATGRDVYAKWRGRYRGWIGALRFLIVSGSIINIPESVGLPRIPARAVHRGDLAGVPTKKGIALGVCLGGRIAAPGVTGLEFIRFNRVKHAWRV